MVEGEIGNGFCLKFKRIKVKRQKNERGFFFVTYMSKTYTQYNTQKQSNNNIAVYLCQ